AVLRSGESVVVFPEGTTSEGGEVGRFHAAFFQAAVDAGVPVQPVAIHYPTRDGAPDPAAAFVGEMTFVESLARVLRRRQPDARAASWRRSARPSSPWHSPAGSNRSPASWPSQHAWRVPRRHDPRQAESHRI